jgi:hypothetical protein
MKHLWLYKYLNVLKQNHQFLSTHGRIKKFHQDNILLDMVEVKDIEIHKTTKKKLKLVSNLLFIDWLYCIPYFACSLEDRKGYFYYGLSFNGNLVNYHRKETLGRQAGQTLIHIDNSTLQITKLLDDNKYLTKRDNKSLIKLKELININGVDKMLFENL